LHYDLRLEIDGVLKSWAVPKEPVLDPAVKRLAMQVEDHPLDYLRFHGTIPKGNYGAGTVELWDLGTLASPGRKGRAQSEADLKHGLAKGHLRFVLKGRRLRGEFSLIKVHSKDFRGNAWLLLHHGLSATKILQEDSFHRPMLSTLVEEVDDREGWIYEPKLDGYRAMAEVGQQKVRLYSRNFKDFAQRFAPITRALLSFERRAVLDGEIVALDPDGVPRFQLLQDWVTDPTIPLCYYVFDLLELDGRDLRSLPLFARKMKLDSLTLPKDSVRLCSYVKGKGRQLLETAVRQGLEGIVAKDGNSPYREGWRGQDWLKVKRLKEQEAVIAGYTEPQGSRKDLGALILGVYESGNLVYVGHTGTGFDAKTLAGLRARLEPMRQEDCPFAVPPPVNAPAHWVKPELVCQVSFQEWTSEGIWRIPVFVGLREDVEARDVHRELPEKKPQPPASNEKELKWKDIQLKLTHLNKVYWPGEGITKGDVVRYYESVAEVILPYLKDRPESLKRNPEGIQAGDFFHKNLDPVPYDWLKTVRIRSEDGKTINYLLCQDEASLLFMANLGCIEINPWASRMQLLDYPDYLLIDLDPVDVLFSSVIETARAVHEVLKDMGAEGYCKTSGSKGIHVVLPLGAHYTYEQCRTFSLILAQQVHALLPTLTSLERQPAKRPKRVYLDCFQNARGQTMAAPYCLRPRPGAPISTPLKWAELTSNLDFRDFNLRTIHRRLKDVGDLWKPVLGKGIDMEKCLKKLQLPA
jgi:bifunctional non-homologous end joining protein LigD